MMKNYIYENIKESQYLRIFIKKMFGNAKGTKSYITDEEILNKAKKLSKDLLTTKFLKEFIWYYNLFVSRDTRNNIVNLEELRKSISKIRVSNCFITP